MNILDAVTQYANEQYDGHLTLLKFTSGYRVCYGTLVFVSDESKHRKQIELMREGKSLDEALYNLLTNPVDCYEIYDQVK